MESAAQRIPFSIISDFEILGTTTTIAVTIGYLRKNGFFDFGVKCDDFINIISNYIIEKSLIFGNNTKKINIFGENGSRTTQIDAMNDQFIIAINQLSKQMLSFYNY